MGFRFNEYSFIQYNEKRQVESGRLSYLKISTISYEWVGASHFRIAIEVPL